MSDVEELERQLKEQAKSFCEAHQREVDKVNVLRAKHEAAVRNATEAIDILTRGMLMRDPSRQELMQVLERMQRITRGAKT